MAENGSILVTGAAGQLGAVGRTVTSLLLERGLRVRAGYMFANSVLTVLPSTMPPARRVIATIDASARGRCPE